MPESKVKMKDVFLSRLILSFIILASIFSTLDFLRGKPISFGVGNSRTCEQQKNSEFASVTYPNLEIDDISISRSIDSENSPPCITFFGKDGYDLFINAGSSALLVYPDGNTKKIHPEKGLEIVLSETGEYAVKYVKVSPDERYAVQIKLLNRETWLTNEKDVSESNQVSNDETSESHSIDNSNTSIQQNLNEYGRSLAVPFLATDIFPDSADPKIQEVVNGAVELLEAEGFPIENLSISLVDLNSEVCCKYAGHKDKVERYPASLAKLFWVVMLKDLQMSGASDKIQSNQLEMLRSVVSEDVIEALHDSDNNAASRIVDAISGTVSSREKLSQEDLDDWIIKRQAINVYFRAQNYENVNITQKTFPIPFLDFDGPSGPDLQLRETMLINVEKPPQRNFLTSFEVARLLFEIADANVVSPTVSNQLKQYLYHDHNSEEERDSEYGPIRGFLGENLPKDTKIYTKVGFTLDDGRQEAAIVESLNGETQFILVIFANHPVFSEIDSTAFPLVGQYVYSRMKEK